MRKMLDKHYDTVRKISSECIVLLKSNGNFPISTEEKISLYGGGARHTLRGGTGGGTVEAAGFTTIEQGLKNAGFKIVSDGWLNGYDRVLAKAREKHKQTVKKAIETDGMTGLGTLSVAMREPEYLLPLDGESEAAIYVLARVSGEGADRSAAKGDVFMTETEIRDIRSLAKKYSKFMLVLNVGGVVDISPVEKEVENIMLLSQLGSAAGDALADVICGKNYPSGKLASTWARYGDYCKTGDINPPDDTRYKEGIYVGYRYFDSVNKQPLFHFGFGLGYTSFEIEALEPVLNKSVVTVPVIVKNTGKRTGKEVVQIYVSAPCGKLDKPYQVLAAFKKTAELNAGRSQYTELSFDLKDIASVDEAECCRILEKGDYLVRLGSSSRNTKEICVVRLNKTVVVERLTRVISSPDFEDFKPQPTERYINPNLPVLNLSAGEVEENKHVRAKTDEKALAFVRSLSDEELCYLCTGHFNEKTLNMGLGGSDVPGAAGQTTKRFIGKGVPSLVMADGPAGLHISGQYGIDENGKYVIAGEDTKAIKELLPPDILKALLVMFPDAANDNRGGEIFDQYCTALPIETALAQSWDPEICAVCGKIAGEEMERYGVDIHLAPAINTHRHILCGRNFEYFSEDPYLAGKMAVGMIEGVRANKGKGSMPKHFVCNEQETNRLNSNSIVSERALREIYLRPFEIAVKEGKPIAVMTSYNLINGRHTSECNALIENVLRGEWGFDGLAVSDWVGYKKSPDGDMKHPRARASRSIATGNDLMMPGNKGHYRELLECMRDQTDPLTREQTEICASRIVSTAWKLKGESV